MGRRRQKSATGQKETEGSKSASGQLVTEVSNWAEDGRRQQVIGLKVTEVRIRQKDTKVSNWAVGDRS